MTDNSNQKGFAVIESLLIVIIIAALVGVGVYVWHAQKQTNATLDATSKSAQSTPQNVTKKTAVKDITADWIAYTSKDKSFSIKYPKTWVMASHPELCSDGILLLGPTANSVGHCGSEGFGAVAFTSSSSHPCFPLDDNFSDKTSAAVTISGISGTKETGTVKTSANQAFEGLPAGTKVVQYCFNTVSKHYTASYNQQPTYPDVESDFELIVAKTLKFE